MKVNNQLNCLSIHRTKNLDVGKLKTGGFVLVAHGEKKRPFIVVLDDETAYQLGKFLAW